METLLRPLRFERYIAWSARWMKVDNSSLGWYSVSPILMVTVTVSPASGENGSASNAARIR